MRVGGGSLFVLLRLCEEFWHQHQVSAMSSLLHVAPCMSVIIKIPADYNMILPSSTMAMAHMQCGARQLSCSVSGSQAAVTLTNVGFSSTVNSLAS